MDDREGGDDDLDDLREELYSSDRARSAALKALDHDRRARQWGPAQPSGGEHPAGDATEYQAGLVQTLLDSEQPEHFHARHFNTRWPMDGARLQNIRAGRREGK